MTKLCRSCVRIMETPESSLLLVCSVSLFAAPSPLSALSFTVEIGQAVLQIEGVQSGGGGPRRSAVLLHFQLCIVSRESSLLSPQSAQVVDRLPSSAFLQEGEGRPYSLPESLPSIIACTCLNKIKSGAISTQIFC